MTTNTAIAEAGHGQGFEDACEWIEDEARDLRNNHGDERATKKLADKLRASLASSTEADEGLINALTTAELEKQMGVAYRNADGAITGEAMAWLSAYSRGWRSAVESRLAELEQE